MLMLVACVTPFDFDAETSDDLLVVFGTLTPGPNASNIRLTRTTEFGTNGATVENATITLFDDLGNSESYINLLNGNYILRKENINIVTGRSYHVEIALNGETYRSTPQKMPLLVEADSTYFEIATDVFEYESGLRRDELFIKLYVDTPINGEETSFLRWSIDGVFQIALSPCPGQVPCSCYYPTDNPNTDILLFDGTTISSDRINRVELMSKRPFPNYEYLVRHYFNVYQQALTEETYQYWKAVDLVSRQSGSLFDAVPAAVEGNIFNVSDPDENILGFYQVVNVDTVRTFATQASLRPYEVYQERIPLPCPGNDPSVWNRPSYWGR